MPSALTDIEVVAREPQKRVLDVRATKILLVSLVLCTLLVPVVMPAVYWAAHNTDWFLIVNEDGDSLYPEQRILLAGCIFSFLGLMLGRLEYYRVVGTGSIGKAIAIAIFGALIIMLPDGGVIARFLSIPGIWAGQLASELMKTTQYDVPQWCIDVGQVWLSMISLFAFSFRIALIPNYSLVYDENIELYTGVAREGKLEETALGSSYKWGVRAIGIVGISLFFDMASALIAHYWAPLREALDSHHWTFFCLPIVIGSALVYIPVWLRTMHYAHSQGLFNALTWCFVAVLSMLPFFPLFFWLTDLMRGAHSDQLNLFIGATVVVIQLLLWRRDIRTLEK